MEDRYSVQQLLTLRKATRAVAVLLRGLANDYLTTLSPLLRPTSVLGEYVHGHVRGTVKGAEKAFRDLQALYEATAGAKPFGLAKELRAPIEILSSNPELTPMEYVYPAKSGQETKMVTITTPLKWALTYAGFSPRRFREVISGKGPSQSDAPQFLLHYLVMHTVLSQQPGLRQILETLHFPVVTEKIPGFGDLPVACIASSVGTVRPPDAVIIESTEVSGMNVFEEIVNLEDIKKLRDPLQEKLLAVVSSHGVTL